MLPSREVGVHVCSGRLTGKSRQTSLGDVSSVLVKLVRSGTSELPSISSERNKASKSKSAASVTLDVQYCISKSSRVPSSMKVFSCC